MKMHTFDELDALAFQVLDGEVGPKSIASLSPTERLAALELTFAMALCKLGVLSPKATAAFKLKIYNENKQFAVEFNHLYAIYDRWIDDTMQACTIKSAYDKAMRNGEEHEALGLASIIIGKLTGEGNVHYKLYEQYCTDEDCKAKVWQAAREITDNMDDFDSRPPYSTIVDSLFRFFEPERMVKLWKQLGGDYPKPKSTHVPPKQYNTAWAVRMIEEVYGKIKDKKLPNLQEKQSLPKHEQNVPVQSV